MTQRKSRHSLLDGTIKLLVEHFGLERVKAALTRVSSTVASAPEHQPSTDLTRPNPQVNPTIPRLLDQLRHTDQEKHRLLTAFYAQLKDGAVLPESQDIRQFTQILGLKRISGKSRKSMIPALMRFLLDQPTDKLQSEIAAASTVSEQHRQKGFSIITDKLLGE